MKATKQSVDEATKGNNEEFVNQMCLVILRLFYPRFKTPTLQFPYLQVHDAFTVKALLFSIFHRCVGVGEVGQISVARP